ncbi:cobalamin-independent methionine synthase II family protein [Haloechinothrix sp. YIM 98757]|uniref:Cobalamin-independent methionine synthase II family protein n=1 Tax=Haloechinothrix aidingensis TaxID=2752311 RepID=A0A838ADL2_9PSEU|nr:cobalamin-independent methionine synthase II family protein [Haloechinothrix aidingensis]MBA0127218.1 cobalamin-independent methionine synthase II family protein [Haloechinothrix aidingensis]
MKRSVDRVLTTHTGSFERPEDVNEMITARVLGNNIDDDLFEKRVQEATAEVVARQVECGIDVVSDGETAKPGYLEYVGDRIDGFDEYIDASEVFRFMDMEPFPEIVYRIYKDTHVKIPVCTRPLSYIGHDQVQRDIDNFKAALTQSPPTEAFMPAVSPGLLAMCSPNRYYKSYDEYVLAIGEVMNAEYRAITDAGLLVQIDAPDLAFGADIRTWMWGEVEERGFRTIQDLHVEALNVALQGISPEQVRMHLCWANYNGPHVNDIPVRDALEPAFKANVCGINFEAANAAHAHEWEVFKDLKVPDGKVIIPGVVDSKIEIVERPELISQRIQTYANLVGQENLIAGVDCGFGTFVNVLMVNPRIAWMKLRNLVEGAQMASDELAKKR